MECQKHLFQLQDSSIYLNSAYMSPLLKSVEEAGIVGMQKKRDPSVMQNEDFFINPEILCKEIGTLFQLPASSIALIPSCSYGLRVAMDNVPTNQGTHVLVVENEFPSGYYTAESWCKKNNKEIVTIAAPPHTEGRAKAWNGKILAAINADTAAVLLSSIHWEDGTLFQLEEIGKRCKEMDAYFIVDGTQSVGIMPIDIQKCKIDALSCAAYKWLLAPYSIGFAYYGEKYANGKPIEDSWMPKSNARGFADLTKYVDSYMPDASRYSVGEFSNFILTPMFLAAIRQIQAWTILEMYQYSTQLISPFISYLREKNIWVEADDFRASHLFGFVLGTRDDAEKALKWYKEKNISVSLRGKAIRVSSHIYNTTDDVQKMIAATDEILSMMEKK